MGRILRNYLFWTYPRGSFHYDVMVTLILAFLFLSPLAINYHERPQETANSNHGVLVKTAGGSSLIYDIGADYVGHAPDGAAAGPNLRTELQKRVEEISGSVLIDRYIIQKDPSGRVIEYRVWAHR